MDSREFFTLIRDFFGAKIRDEAVDHAGSEYWCTLYETFRFHCLLDNRYGQFGAGIEYAPDSYFTNFLNGRLTHDSDAQSIQTNLAIVDEWCRLHLPDKFLERYEAALGLTST